MMTFRTNPPVGYLTPTVGEMKEVAQRFEMKKFMRDVVADLANIAAGGSIALPSSYEKIVRETCTQKLPNPSGGQWSTSNGWTSDRQEAITDGTKKQMMYHQKACDFYRSIDFTKFPGNTPLEIAFSVLSLLQPKGNPSGSEEGGDGENFNPFVDMESPEGKADEIEDLMDLAESLSEDEKDMLDPDRKPEGDPANENTPKNDLTALKVANDLKDESQKRIMLEISRKLDQFTKLQVRKQEELKVDPEGEESRIRPMQSLSEINRIGGAEWALYSQAKNLFMYRAVTNQISVSERVTREVRKQVIFILVDGSWSMGSGGHYKASGVVMNRLKAVLAGNAIVFVGVFDTEMKTPHRASNPEEAKTLIKKFTNGNFTGGGTDIAAAVKAAHVYMTDLMAKGELLYKPEVVVLTDDDESASGVKAYDVPGTRVHGFAMNSHNPELRKFCESTGGLCFERF